MKKTCEMKMTVAKSNSWAFRGTRRKLVICSVFLMVFLFAGMQASAAITTNTSLAALNSAISAASSNDVLVLADGTYTDNITLTIGKSGVTVRPVTPGGAYLNNIAAVSITGDNTTFSGFQFTSRVSTNGTIITVSGDRNLLTQLNFNGYNAQKYINLQGQYNEVSYCNFKNKPTASQIGNLIHTALSPGVPGYHKIRYNSFQDMPGAGGDNGNECIRLENGAQSTYVGRTVVEFNYFNNTGPGDSEVISVKCRENVLRYNTFTNNQDGMMCFRNGDSNIAYGNFFINAGGIRVKEANDTYCYNNYFEKSGSSGTMGSVLYVYDTTVTTNVLKNINFFHNTFVNCGTINLDTGATAHTWANNIFSNTSGNIFMGATNGIKWAGNQYSGTLGIVTNSGMVKTNSLLVRNSDGYYGLASNSPAINAASTNYPAILNIANVDDDPSLLLDVGGLTRPASTILKDVGCSEYTTGAAFNHPLALTDVGPSYLGGPSTIVNVAPSVNLFAPTNGAVFAAPASITMTANAVDPDGTITSVSFYNGTNLLGSDTVAPYTNAWTNVAAGSYSLTARATDNSGAVSTSAVVPVTSWLPPPSDNFNLSHWKLQLPTSNGILTGAAGSVDEISPAALTNGYTSDYFYTAANGAMVFWAPDNGSTTSGSTHPRSELREMIDTSDSDINWTVYGTHIMTATLKVTQVSPDNGKVCIGQMHEPRYLAGTTTPGAGNEQMIMFDLDLANSANSRIYANISMDGDSGASSTGFTTNLITGSSVALSNTITYTMSMVDGLLTIAISNTTTNFTQSWNLLSDTYRGIVATNWDRASLNTLYYKAGSYNQASNRIPDQGAKVEFSSLNLYHSATITNQPDSVTNMAGGDVSFTVGASGNGTLGYQWRFNGANLSGKTSATLALNNIATTDAGDYTVVVSDNTSSFSAITSAVATLTVLTNTLTVVPFDKPGISNWICPAGITSVQVECWGGGGAGGSALRSSGSSTVYYGGGGAGGAYAKYISYPVTPGNTYYINVGTGGINNASVNDTTVAGGDSWFNTNNSPSTVIIAKGGAGGQSASGGTGGDAFGIGGTGTTNGSIGNVVYAGGGGATAAASSAGGGGSSAGTTTNGTSATSNVGATAPAGGGDGGTGPTTSSTAGGNGSFPGGAGAGARATTSLRTGGTGSVGRVVLTYVESRYTLTVNSGAGNGSYSSGQQVAISANAPATGKTFSQWTGDTQYVNNVTYTNALVTMPTNAVTLTATYVDVYYPLTVNSGSGDGSYTNGTKVPVSADAPAAGKVFSQWTGDTAYVANSNSASSTVTMSTRAITLTATYVDVYYALTVTGGTGGGSFTNGRQVAISANAPAPGKAFSQWTGDTQYVNNVTYTNALVTMSTNPVSLTATYTDASYALTVTGGSGGSLYTNGTQVAISANAPATGKAFDQWIGDTQYVNNVTYTNALVTMSTNAVSLTATYMDVLYTLTVTGGTGAVASATNGTQVEISADAPITGMTFDKWTGDTQYVAGVSSSNTTVTMPAQAVALSSTYKILPGYYTLTVSNGTGGGIYSNGVQVTVTAVAPAGTAFDRWTGDTQIVAGVFSLSTIVTMPAQDAALTASCADVSNGVASVEWTASAGFYFDADPNVGILGDGTGNKTITQLMYSPDNVKDNILSNRAGSVNDVVWDTITLTENGLPGDFDDYAFFAPQNCTRALTNGYVYALIFQDNNVQPGDWYYSTPLVAIDTNTSPQSIEMNTDTVSGDPIDGTYGAQVIAESSTYTLTVNSGSGSGTYTNTQVVAIAASNAPSGKVFDRWIGDTQVVNNVTYTNALVTMSTNAVALTATYVDVYYTLTVNSGTGGGSYTNGRQVAISANAISGQTFDRWTGDTQYVASVSSASTTVTMPAQAIALTATYTYSTLLLDVNFEGQAAGSQPTGTAYLRPTANSVTQAVQVVSSTLLGGTQAVQYLDRAVNTATSSSLQYNFASNGAVICSFSFSPLYTNGLNANFMSVGLGQQVTLNSSTLLFSEVRIRGDGSIQFYSAGTSIGSVTGLAAGSSNTVSMFVNDTAADIIYAGGTRTNLANTVDYYFNGSLVYAGASFGTNAAALGTTNGMGRFAIFDASTRTDLDYLIDNIAVSEILPPANVSATAAAPTGNGTGTGGLTVAEGSSITLTEIPSAGTPPFTYAWKKVGSGAVLGTSSNLLIFSPTNGAQYTCDVAATWDGVTNTSPAVTVTVVPLVSATAAVPTGNGSGAGGMTVYPQRTRMTLTEIPSGGTAPFTYAWKKVGSGAVLGTNSTLTISPLVNGDQYVCDVASTSDGVTNTSPTATVTVNSVIDSNKVAIIKADDFRASNWSSPSWTNFLIASRDLGIRVNPGAVVTNIGGNASIAQWMQGQEAAGDVEFWNHGWDHSQWTVVNGSVTTTVYEFKGSDLAFQQTHLADSQAGLSNALGHDVIAFGTPYNQFDTNTTALVNDTSALRLFFATSLSTPRTAGLDARVDVVKIVGESPPYGDGTGMPNAETFKSYFPSGPTGPVALQFHPADSNFDANRVAQYQEIVQYLLTNGYAFLMSSEYVELFAPNTAPGVSLTAPTDNASFTAPASITMTASASDTDGTVTNVGFYNGATLLGSDASAPYTYTWTNVAPGSYSLTARATDNDGAVSTSAVVAVTVLDPVYTLTVNSGTGAGSYTNGQQVAISAYAPAAGKAFGQWTGDTQYVNNVTYTNATVTMSTNAVTLTATYVDVYYALTVNNGTGGGGSYTNGTQVAIAANAPAAGKAFDKWIGDTQYVDNASSLNTTVTMPAQAITLTATYADVNYSLTINYGTGGGLSYTNEQQVAILANAPAAGKAFDKWIGDTQFVDNANSASTWLTMPAQDVVLTATYVDVYYALTVNSGSGSGSYTNGHVQAIVANAAAPGMAFVAWTGDTVYLANSNSASTTVTMPTQAVSVTATYMATEQYTTNAIPVPYSWLAGYGITNNQNAAVLLDPDGDGLTTEKEYIAGTVPTNAASVLKAAQTVRNVVTWTPQSNRIYSVYWSTNLVKGFSMKQDNILYPTNSFTNTTPDSRINHYQIKVRMQ